MSARLGFSILLLLLSAAPAFADGKVFWRPENPPGLPMQRAFLVHDGTEETFIIQVKLEGKVQDFGWVVPVPAVPKVAAVKAEKASDVFRRLAWKTKPRVVDPSLVFAGALLLLSILSWVVYASKKTRGLRAAAIGCFFASLLLLLTTSTMMGSRDGVDVLMAEDMGSYHVKVVRGKDGSSLVAWLKEHEFSFSGEDTTVFDSYAKEGWCFVTARVRSEVKKEDAIFLGYLDALAMRFPSDRPVYPLALTSTAGQKVFVRLYAVAEKRQKTDGRLKLHYAGPFAGFRAMTLETEPEGFLEKGSLSGSFLTRFEGELTPKQMATDLYLESDGDSSYRRTVFR